ncbi:hypothetical protein [Actinomadura sp. 9N407]|uniref:hypothetical protein n=1 Tax=Actinomadura sp. 9N407 TaxID=3375154 RepID=UPI0037AEF396
MGSLPRLSSAHEVPAPWRIPGGTTRHDASGVVMSFNQVADETGTKAAQARRAGAQPGNALDVAARSFRFLITGPSPLAVDGRKLGHGLPPRQIDLGELLSLLLDRTATDALKDAAWVELIARARTGDPAWVIGCVGVAMPGLKNIAARLIRSSPTRFADDIVSELLTEFVAQLARIDTTRPNISARLMLWARKGALRALGWEARHLPRDPWELSSAPHVNKDTDPVLLLLDAVRREIITPAAASLIIATRLDAASVRDIAREQGISSDRLYRQRREAESRLVAAIRNGTLFASSPC